jgi:hypothetical protein
MISNFEKSKVITMGKTELDAEYDTDATADVFEKYIPKEKKDTRYKVLYLLLADYRRIFKDFTENKNIKGTSGYNNFSLKLDTYMGNFLEKLQGLLNDIHESKRDIDIDIARELLKVLSLCLNNFPNIFSKVLPNKGIVLNATPFELYQEPKATEMDREVFIENIKPKGKNEVGLQDINLSIL